MKQKLITLILAAAVFSPSCTKGPEPVPGVLDFMAGAVTVTDDGKTSPARVGDVVRRGALIRTGANSFAQIAIGGNLVQVYEQSSLILGGMARGGSGAEETAMHVGQGTVFSKVKKLVTPRKDSFTVSSCVMVAAVRGTEFLYTVDCTTGKVICFEGVVSVRAADGTEEIRLAAGEMLSIEPGKQGMVTPVPKKFRYRDFEYGKNAYMPGGASGEGAKQGGAVIGSADRDVERTASKTGATDGGGLTTASRKSAEASSLSRKSSDISASKPGSGGSTAAEKAAVKKKDAGLATTSEKTAAGKTSGTATSTTSRAVKPGGLLEKPRVKIPELK